MSPGKENYEISKLSFFSMLIVNLYPALMNHPADNLYALMNPGSEMTALPIILLSSAVWNKLLRTYPLHLYTTRRDTAYDPQCPVLMRLCPKTFVLIN